MATQCTHISTTSVRLPAPNSLIYKDECTLCFDNWDQEAGIYVCMSCYNGGCLKHAKSHFQKRNHQLALNIRRVKKKLPENQEPPAKITKVAIGLPGGVGVDNEDMYEYESFVFCFACDKLAEVVTALLLANSASKTEDLKSWENKITQCAHTTKLQQDANAPKLGKRSLSHCGSCEIGSSLWLCMTCGHLGCSRKNYDGSGGNGHALAHYDSTKHPVVVKIGTITAEGNADVHCYACDEMRLDPELVGHLKHLGIEAESQEKTEKTIAEMELEMNTNPELFAKTHEGDQVVKNLSGPGYTGLQNLGNTCYMASVLQTVFAMPEFVHQYFDGGMEHQQKCSNTPQSCYHCQMAKLAHGLLSGKYSTASQNVGEKDKVVDQDGVPPRMLKSLMCKDHPEFSTNRQQDAYEFFQYFLKTVQIKEKPTGQDPTNIFNFDVESKLICSKCKRVRYSSVKQSELSLSIPTSKAEPPLKPVEGEKPDERMKREKESKVDISHCFNSFLADEELDIFSCPNCNTKTTATKHYRLKNFPKYLTVQFRRFVLEEGWVPKKLSVNVSNVEKVSLEKLRAPVRDPSEQELTESSGPEFVIDESALAMLMDMSFTKNQCQRALYFTKNNLEQASQWIFDHMDDSDINDPLPQLQPNPKKEEKKGPTITQDAVNELVAMMACSSAKARKALSETDANPERAVEWLLNHMDDADEEEAPKTESKQEVEDKQPANYELLAVIVHLGSGTHSGHYVAYVKKDGKWAHFNDRKVTESITPPLGAGYLYFFKRV